MPRASRRSRWMRFWSANRWSGNRTSRQRCENWRADRDEPMRVKICGITNREDAGIAAAAGAHALGFVFAPSPRQVTPEMAATIIAGLPPLVQTVGVFVDQDVAA